MVEVSPSDANLRLLDFMQKWLTVLGVLSLYIPLSISGRKFLCVSLPHYNRVGDGNSGDQPEPGVGGGGGGGQGCVKIGAGQLEERPSSVNQPFTRFGGDR